MVITGKLKQQHSYSVSLVTQGRHKFYSLTMPSEVLARTCYASTRFDDPQEGFQRTLDVKRAQEIAEYIDSGLGTIPNSIVLSAQADAGLQYDSEKKTISFKNTKKAFLILDGQHRVYGFSLAQTSLRVPVVIYNNLSRRDETRLFIDINTKQRPVPNELLLDIKNLAEYEDDTEKIIRDVFDQFNEDQASPLLGMLSASTRQKNKISRVTFRDAMKPLLEVFSGYQGEEMYQILSAYLSAVLSGLSAKGIRESISSPTLFKAVFLLFADVAPKVKDKFGKAYTIENFNEVLESFYPRVKQSLIKRPGSSHRALHEQLQAALRSCFVV